MTFNDGKRAGWTSAAQMHQCHQTAKPAAHNRDINLRRRCVNPANLLA
jgi:hypothetical protein